MKTFLLSDDQTQHESARDLVASLLTGSRGEFIFRIGARPAHNKLFAGEVLDDGWTGTDRGMMQLDTLASNLIKTVEEVGGKASSQVRTPNVFTDAVLCRHVYYSRRRTDTHGRQYCSEYLHPAYR